MTSYDAEAAASGILQPEAAYRSGFAEQSFRDAMASMASTACVVAARDGEERLGRTVTAAFSLSLAPPSILVSIDAGSALAAMIRERRGFSFAMLSHAQQAVADAFAGKGPVERRFSQGDWREWRSRRPRLLDAVVAMDCVVVAETDMAGHTLFAGAVQEIDLNDGRDPLVWHRRRYSAVYPPRQA